MGAAKKKRVAAMKNRKAERCDRGARRMLSAVLTRDPVLELLSRFAYTKTAAFLKTHAR